MSDEFDPIPGVAYVGQEPHCPHCGSAFSTSVDLDRPITYIWCGATQIGKHRAGLSKVGKDAAIERAYYKHMTDCEEIDNAGA